MKRLLFLLLLTACPGTDSSLSDMPPGGDGPSSSDLARPPLTDGFGTKMFGEQCFTPGTPGDCAPGLICDMFVRNTINRCTRLCDMTPTPTNCPAPSAGTCNGKGECKFTQ